MSRPPPVHRNVRKLSRRDFEERYRALPTTDNVLSVLDPTTMSRQEFCEGVTRSLIETGLLILRSPNVNLAVRERMQQGTANFFALPKKIKAKTMTKFFQGGWTPPFAERPQDQAAFVQTLSRGEEPFWE